ncbi:MAG: XdhC family protein [Pseudomonadota bacterium]
MNAEHLKAVNAAIEERRTVVLVTPLDGAPARLVTVDEAPSDPLAEEIVPRLRSGKSGVVATEAGEVFLRVHRPSPRLVIIGAVHVSQALAPMAEATGFDVTIIDPREAFATPERFEGHRVLADWPDASNMALDDETAVATLTHDPKIDDPALLAAMAADCFYIGALGSRKTHAKRVDRMKAQGVKDSALMRINAPIGLAIGAASPQEIAVSVLAQIIDALRSDRTAGRDLAAKAAASDKAAAPDKAA